MFHNFSIIWLFDEANASFNAISFLNYLQIQNDLTTSSGLTQTWQYNTSNFMSLRHWSLHLGKPEALPQIPIEIARRFSQIKKVKCLWSDYVPHRMGMCWEKFPVSKGLSKIQPPAHSAFHSWEPDGWWIPFTQSPFSTFPFFICLRQREGISDMWAGRSVGLLHSRSWNAHRCFVPCCTDSYSQVAAPKVQPYVLEKLLWSFNVQVDS